MPEHYNRHMNKALVDAPSHLRVMDDILVLAPDIQTMYERTRQMLERCRANKITLAPETCKFCLAGVTFAGLQIGQEGYKLNPDVFEAVRSFPTPSCITDMRSFMRLANQLTGQTNRLAHTLGPLRELMSKKYEFMWLHPHQAAFKTTKELLARPEVLAYFDTRKKTASCLTPAGSASGTCSNRSSTRASGR